LLFIAFLAATLLLLGNAHAQQSTSNSGNESRGARSTVTVTAGATFKTPPGSVQILLSIGHATTIRRVHGRGFSMPAGTVQIPVPVAAAVTIQEVHGNVSFTFWQADGCSSGSVVAQILYQEGNVLAAVFEMVRNGALC
jgi:hypothetical protein